jgi:TolB-like protein/tetratricopeptide (TPR) repeat protein
VSFFAELKRRNVIRVGFAYAVVAWVVAQVAEFAFENFGAPEWVLKSVVVMLALGLPLVLVFAWAFELTPEGIKLEKEVDRSQSITSQTGRKLDRTIIVVLAVALAWFAWDKFIAAPDQELTAAALEQATAELPPEPEQTSADSSVAVLPFIAMSSGPDDEYFADGLTEEILNSLAQLPELLVTARTSAFSFKGRDLPIQEIAAMLGVRHVVEGSVRRSGERLRVTAQLIRAEDGFHLWSENYDSTSADMIEVQENIAEKIATALNVVLDEGKREAMREYGLRNPAAFTLYQKGFDYYERAHGRMDQREGLRLANGYFEQVMDLVPEYWEVYAVHSDRYVHMLNDVVTGNEHEGVTEETLVDAYQTILADYEASARFAPTDRLRYVAELDLAFLSGNWRGLAGRLEKAVAEPGCRTDGNWSATVASVLGYSAEYYKLAEKQLECDPLRNLNWFNAVRARFWMGDAEGALRMAREGVEVAPGGWLTMTLLQTLAANGLHDEAHSVIEAEIQVERLALVFHTMIAAHRGDRDRLAPLLENLDTDREGFFSTVVAAWTGRRAIANAKAAAIDEHFWGPIVLWQLVQWCQCGAPWDLEVTPNFAAKAREANLTWPPVSPLTYPLKDW